MGTFLPKLLVLILMHVFILIFEFLDYSLPL